MSRLCLLEPLISANLYLPYYIPTCGSPSPSFSYAIFFAKKARTNSTCEPGIGWEIWVLGLHACDWLHYKGQLSLHFFWWGKGVRLWLPRHREQYSSGCFWRETQNLLKDYMYQSVKGTLCLFLYVTRFLHPWTTFAKSMLNTLYSQNKNLIARSAKYLKAVIQIKRV